MTREQRPNNVNTSYIREDYWQSLPTDERRALRYMPAITILGFGGTIAMAPGKNGDLRPAATIEELVDQAPALKEMATLRLYQLRNKDSTNITPKDWRFLTRRIQDAQNSGAQGVIVTHGTDTMAYAASAVALALGRGLRIPVVFTGSQLPMRTAGTDARFNMENAVQTISAANKHHISEVMITFADKVLRAVRTIKISEANFPAFDSPAVPPLANITAHGIHFRDFALHHDGTTKLAPTPNFFRHIFTADVVPGLDPSLLFQVIRSNKCRGILLRSLGIGNVPSEGAYSLLPVIKEAKQRNIPVLISTKFTGGTTDLSLYEPGVKSLALGAIQTLDMTETMAQVKLMWLLGRRRNGRTIDLAELKDNLMINVVGEISN